MPVVKLAACAVCLRTPCACPDPADESDEQAAQEEADYVRALLSDFERFEGRTV
jgi:hypothetical protein